MIFQSPYPGHLLTPHRPKHTAPVTGKRLMRHHCTLPAFHWRISSDPEITLIFNKKSCWDAMNTKALNTIITLITPKWAAQEPEVSKFRSQGSQSLTVIHQPLARRTLNMRFPKPKLTPRPPHPQRICEVYSRNPASLLEEQIEGARRRVTQLQLKIQQETGGLVVSDGRLSSRKGSCRRMEGSVREQPRTEASRVTQAPGAESVCAQCQRPAGLHLAPQRLSTVLTLGTPCKGIACFLPSSSL